MADGRAETSRAARHQSTAESEPLTARLGPRSRPRSRARAWAGCEEANRTAAGRLLSATAALRADDCGAGAAAVRHGAGSGDARTAASAATTAAVDRRGNAVGVVVWGDGPAEPPRLGMNLKRSNGQASRVPRSNRTARRSPEPGPTAYGEPAARSTWAGTLTHGMRKVASRVYEVSLPRRGIPVNAFLIAGDSLVLVDTGVPGRWPHLVNAIREIGRDPAEIRHVGITHHHIDHVGSLASVVEQTGAEVFAHPSEARLLNGTLAPPTKVGRSLSSRIRISLSERIGWRQAAPAEVDHEVADGAEMVGTGLRVIHTPGHTAGHLAFLHSASGVLFVGDAAANVFGRLSRPVGNHDEDNSAMVASVAKLAQIEFDTACFGHGRSIPSGARRRLIELAERLSG